LNFYPKFRINQPIKLYVVLSTIKHISVLTLFHA